MLSTAHIGTVVVKGLISAHGPAYCVSKISYWSVMSVGRDFGLSCSQWRASKCKPPVAVARSRPMRHKLGKQSATRRRAKHCDKPYWHEEPPEWRVA